MNFFKKVITFFSAIWNAILWRKSDKKAKQAAKPAETADPIEDSSNPTSETDKLFVDIPLHPPEANDSSEQELLTREEIPTAFTQPVVAHNIAEHHSRLDPGIRKYSSGVQLFGFEDDTTPTLSFFSEPLRDDSELPVHNTIEEKDKDENAGNQSAISQITRELDLAAEVVKDDQARDIFGLPVSEELPSPPNEPIPEPAEQLKSNDDNAPDLASRTPPITSLNDTPQLEALHFSVDDLDSFPSDRSFTFTKGKINPDLNDLAIGDDTHLFDHDGVTDILPNLEESVKNERALLVEATKLARDVQTLPIMDATENNFNKIECNQTIATSCTNEASFGISVSTQAIVDIQKHTTESTSKYSTNYLVKSDSLVNFFPEVGFDVNDNAGVETEVAKKSVTHKNEQLSLDHTVSILKEGDMEEIMCTPRGVLKLSGDHHVDINEEKNVALDANLHNNVKTAVDDFLMDAFAFEEPLLITHLEGNVMEDTRDISPDPPVSRCFQGAIESGLDGSESVDELDTLTNDELLIENEAIGRCRSVIREGPISPQSRIVSRNGSPKVGRDEEEENKKSPCKLSQFTTFHFDDEPKCVENSKQSDIIVPGILTERRGEIPASSRLSDFLPKERGTSSADQTIERTELFLTGQQNDIELLDDPEWPVNIALTGLEEVTGHETCPNYLQKQAGSVLGIDEKANRNFSMDQDSHSGANETVNDYYPFIDCSSYLFRIPEEIRKEPTFNPCVGAAPSRRSSYTSNNYLETSGYDDEHNAYHNTYSNMNSMVPTCAGTVPLINTCIPEEYKNATIEKVPDEYSNRHVSHEIGTFWGGHPGLEHPVEQQQPIVGYPVSCNENYYDDNDVNVMPTTAYETDQTNMCANPERYGYVNPYGAVQFPMLSIPFCNPQSQSAYMPRGTLAPLVFPIGSMNSSGNENAPSVINLHATAQSERFSIHHPWEAHFQNDDEEREIVSLVGGMTPIENLSCTGTNDDDDDDLDNNPIPDQYLLLAENNSLHTVKSKADSYSGSLFCESLRSLISHTTENENIFPSFSCSSVQGCCPSIVLQSCETTVSSDSLPSIIVEETTYSRSVDEDYLATEKFMNDVNTALNESVLDQIQGQGDLHSNLLGRGDGSLSIGPGQSGNEGHVETSLGENISINNSKLTLFDGILGLDGDGNEQEQHLFCEFEGESSSSAFFREVVETIVEGVITTSLDAPTPAPEIGGPETHADCREYVEENGNQRNTDRDLVVQNMMFIEGLPPNEMGLGCRGGSRPKTVHQENKANYLPLEQLLGELFVPKMSVETAFKNAGDANSENTLASVVDDVHNKKVRRSRRRRKKLSDVDSEIERDPSMDVPGAAVGDSVYTNTLEPNSDNVEDVLPSSSEVRHTLDEPAGPKADGEKFVNNEKGESPVGEQEVQQFEDEGDGHQEEGEETGENSGNPSNNRRRRNRRRKRRN